MDPAAHLVAAAIPFQKCDSKSKISNTFLKPQALFLDTSSHTHFRQGDTPPITPTYRDGNVHAYQCITGRDSVSLSPPRTPRVGYIPQTPRSSRASSTSSVLQPEPEYILQNKPILSGSLEQIFPVTLGARPLRPYPPQGTFTVFKDSRPYGHGAWSVVRQGLFIRCSSPTSHEVVAVKQPISKSAISVLAHEATVLSYLSSQSQVPTVVPFYGFDIETTSLLFPALPLTMEQFVKESNSSINSDENLSLSTMRCPVVKMRQWLFFAYRLCQGLLALKDKGVVHGDIKLGNILLREYVPSRSFYPLDELEALLADKSNDKDGDRILCEPLIADFSSSHIIEEPQSGLVQKEINAVTIGYCAPELLELFLLPTPVPSWSTPPRTPNGTAPPSSSNTVEAPPLPIPTFASDLYSLSITLLASAIGSEPYAIKGATDTRKGMYAKCGDPIGFARGDERGLRCGKGGVVASCLEGCFGKRAEGRTVVEAVIDRVTKWVRIWSREGRGNDRWGC